MVKDRRAGEMRRSGNLETVRTSGDLALSGGNSGKRRYNLVHPLAAAKWTRYATLFDVGDVESLIEFLLAILTEKNI